jgi:hypothetical protein
VQLIKIASEDLLNCSKKNKYEFIRKNDEKIIIPPSKGMGFE